MTYKPITLTNRFNILHHFNDCQFGCLETEEYEENGENEERGKTRKRGKRRKRGKSNVMDN